MRLFRKSKGNKMNYQDIGKEMDAVMAKVDKFEAETKKHADLAVQAHTSRLAAEQELLGKQAEVAKALEGIVSFIKNLTTLPPLVLSAESAQRAEEETARLAKEAEFAQMEAERVAEETTPEASVGIPVSTPAQLGPAVEDTPVDETTDGDLLGLNELVTEPATDEVASLIDPAPAVETAEPLFDTDPVDPAPADTSLFDEATPPAAETLPEDPAPADNLLGEPTDTEPVELNPLTGFPKASV